MLHKNLLVAGSKSGEPSRMKTRTGIGLRGLVSLGLIWLVVRKLEWSSVCVILERSDWRVLAVASALMMLMMLPITVNGHGLRELVLIYYFQVLHILPASGGVDGAVEFVVSLSLLMVANELLWSLPGGIIYMARFRGIR